jgi:4-amino-4-deoxy-L-arabinose transferase-like glycosyltransferase
MYAREQRFQQQEWLMLLSLLVVGCLIRLWVVTQPFVDGWSWRQADVAMIAENFYRHGFNIFYPQINWAGPAPGYVGTEFPLVPFFAAQLYRIFGVQDWIGRAISVAFFAASVLFLYLLIKRVSTAGSGLFAVGVYTLTPLSVLTSRSFMPDMASLSFSIAALALCAEWLARAPHTPLFLATSVATSLAILIKAPAIIIGLPLCYMAWTTYGVQLFRRRDLWVFAAVALLPAAMWYAHAYWISRSYPPYHFFGAGGIAILDWAWYMDILSWMSRWFFTPVVLVTMLLGSLLPSRAPYGGVFHWWVVAIIIFIVTVGRGNAHPWYQLPLVPVAAAFTGRFLERMVHQLTRWLEMKIALAVICLLFFLPLTALGYLALKPLYHSWAMPLWQAGQALDQLALSDGLVLAVDYGEPSLLYYSRRKGWHFPEISFLYRQHPPDSQYLVHELESRRKEGARYLVLTQYAFWWFDTYPEFHAYLEERYHRMQETEAYIIFDLTGVTVEERK